MRVEQGKGHSEVTDGADIGVRARNSEESFTLKQREFAADEKRERYLRALCEELGVLIETPSAAYRQLAARFGFVVHSVEPMVRHDYGVCASDVDQGRVGEDRVAKRYSSVHLKGGDRLELYDSGKGKLIVQRFRSDGSEVEQARFVSVEWLEQLVEKHYAVVASSQEKSERLAAKIDSMSDLQIANRYIELINDRGSTTPADRDREVSLLVTTLAGKYDEIFKTTPPSILRAYLADSARASASQPDAGWLHVIKAKLMGWICSRIDDEQLQRLWKNEIEPADERAKALLTAALVRRR